MRRKFQTLRFTPRKSRGRLPQPQIAQSDLVEDLQLRGDPGRAREKRQGLAHRELKHLVDVPVAIAHFEHAALEARSTALLTDKFHISQELHLDGDRAVSLARLTPPAGDVERESPCGRCEACQGDGTVTVEMQFLADVELICEE